jgi:hypothetical protein
LILVVVIMIFGGFTAYVGFHVGRIEQIVMSATYTVMAGILIWQVSLATLGGEGYFVKAARSYLESRKQARLPIIRATKSNISTRNERSLASYLLLPRPEDWSKWLIAPGVFLATAWSTGDFSRWPEFLPLWLILEYLIYEARYQWNDIRGIGDDQSHAESRARGRLPAGSADKLGRVILISMGVAVTRLAMAGLAGWGLGLGQSVLVLIVIVFAIAIAYEALRAVRWKSVPTRATPTAIAIWLVVGLGYGVRSGLGFANAGYRITDWRFIAGVSCFVTFGIMFVLMTWVLEAMSFRYVDISGTWKAKQQEVSKGHAILLLKYVPVIVGEAAVKPGTRDLVNQPDGTKVPILDTSAKIATPWNCALAASASLGGVLGAALAHARPVHPAVMTFAIASLTFSAILASSNSPGMRVTVVLTGYAVITAAAIFFCRLPYVVLAGAPWIPVALLYLLFRGSSYRDLKNLGPQIHLVLTRLVTSFGHGCLLLLKVIVGDRTWAFYSARKKGTSTGAKP